MFSSCGADSEDEIELAIESANSYLTSSNCKKAIEVLEAVGRQNENGTYLRTLASAYACRAGYSTTTLISTDLTKFGDPSPLGGMATFTTSASMDGPENQSYEDMQEAIDILLYAGGIAKDKDPTMTRRDLIFDADTAGDINAMIMYLTMVQIGKYLYFFGNTDATGIKGTGSFGSNTCLLNYDQTIELDLDGSAPPETMADYLTALGGTGNLCDETSSGSLYLGASGSLNETRMCQGIVMLNNFFHVFPDVIDQIGGGSFDSITAIAALIDTAKTEMTNAMPSSIEIANVLSQTKCEALSETDNKELQAYFAFIVEPLFDQ